MTAKPWSADKVEIRKLASLKPYAANPRLHSESNVGKIAASIREFGFAIPILIDETAEIIAGHGRAMAAKALGLDSVPVIVAKGWSKAQIAAYRIADNAIALDSEWSTELLQTEIAELKAVDFNLELLGFDPKELLGYANSNPGQVDPEETPEPSPEPIVRTGDLWTLGRHSILCGDSTDAGCVERVLDGRVPNLMVTDPPYGVEYDATHRRSLQSKMSKPAQGIVYNDNRADWSESWAHFAGNVAYIWHAGTMASEVAIGLKSCGFEIRRQIIWAKSKFVVGRGHYHVQHEPCWYAVRNHGNWQGSRTQSTLWAIEHRKSETGHSTQKPIECMKRPIENNSQPGDFVYEPFSGSGTTIIAAEMTGRSCIAIELDPAYVQIAVERWMKFTGLPATLDGKPFDQVAKERKSKIRQRQIAKTATTSLR